MTRWTQGPWEVSGKQSIRGPQGEYIAKANWRNGPANANMIAAGPDLYAALSDFVAMGEQYGWDEATTGRAILMKAARDAMAKAKGAEGGI